MRDKFGIKIKACVSSSCHASKNLYRNRKHRNRKHRNSSQCNTKCLTLVKEWAFVLTLSSNKSCIIKTLVLPFFMRNTNLCINDIFFTRHSLIHYCFCSVDPQSGNSVCELLSQLCDTINNDQHYSPTMSIMRLQMYRNAASAALLLLLSLSISNWKLFKRGDTIFRASYEG